MRLVFWYPIVFRWQLIHDFIHDVSLRAWLFNGRFRWLVPSVIRLVIAVVITVIVIVVILVINIVIIIVIVIDGIWLWCAKFDSLQV